tara:strand:- start:3208 stop:3789 length:582 start_codon:yes stop_codon:yes gene_type:complete
MFSLENALTNLGYSTIVSNDKKTLLESDVAILPGVGAFPEAMSKLKYFDLIEPIKDFVNQSKILIGICLGMHLLFEFSDEFQHTAGLGLMKGNVAKINNTNEDVIIPHMGWNNLTILNNQYFRDFDRKKFYFVHSFHIDNYNKEDLVSLTNYFNIQIPSIMVKKNILAFQFHPEKSGKNGLSLLDKVLKFNLK